MTRTCPLSFIERKCGLVIYNMGTGHGYSVLDMVNAFMKINGVNVPYTIKPRRPGDIATCYSNTTKAQKELGFIATKTIEDMVKDAWNYESKNIKL